MQCVGVHSVLIAAEVSVFEESTSLPASHTVSLAGYATALISASFTEEGAQHSDTFLDCGS